MAEATKTTTHASQKPSSKLRNEVFYGSTDHEDHPAEPTLSPLPDSQILVPETQLEDEALLERCTANKKAPLEDNGPLQVKFLSKQNPESADDILLQPNFAFMKHTAAKRTSSLEDGSQSHTFAKPGNIKRLSDSKERSSSASVGINRKDTGLVIHDLRNDIIKVDCQNQAKGDYAKAKAVSPFSTSPDVQVGSMYDSAQPSVPVLPEPPANATDNRKARVEAEQKAPNLNEEAQKASMSKSPSRRVNRIAKKSRVGQGPPPSMVPWPPRSHSDTHDLQTPEDGHVARTKPNADTLIVAAKEGPTSFEKDGGSNVSVHTRSLCSLEEIPADLKDTKMPNVNDFVELTTEVEKTKVEDNHAKGTANGAGVVTSPRVPPRDIARMNQPIRVSKNHKKQKPQKPVTSSLTTLAPKSSAQIFEQHIDSLRVSYYAESVRLEHRYGVEVKVREDKIAELQDQVKEYRTRIQALEQNEVDRRVVIQCQQEKVASLQKYVRGLFKDHTKLQETTKAHQERCSAQLSQKIIELQHEKAALEQDFRHTITVLERSRRATKDVLRDGYAQLKASEAERSRLLDRLKVQNALVEKERKRGVDLEQQIKSLLQSVEGRLMENFSKLLESVGKIQDTLIDRSADDERAAWLKQVIECLHQLKQTPILLKSDLQQAETMLVELSETLDSKITALTQSVQECWHSREDGQSDLRTEICKLKDDILRFEEVNSQLQRCQQDNEALKQQLASDKMNGEQLLKRVENLNAKNTRLENRNEKLQSQLDAWRAERESDSGLPPRKQLRELADGLRQQYEDAQQSLRTVAFELEDERKRLWQQDKEMADLKAHVQQLETSLDESENGHRAVLKTSKRQFQAQHNALLDEHARAMQEKDSEWSTQLSRVSQDKDENESQLADVRKELEGANEGRRNAESKIQETERDLTQLRIDVAEATTRLDSLRGENNTFLSELSYLKEQLDLKQGEIEGRDRELSVLREERLGLDETNSRLVASIESYKSQLADRESLSREAQEDFKRRLTKQSNDAMTALQDALNRTAALETEKAELEKARSAALAENAILQKQVADAEKAKQLAESGLRRSHEQKAELMKSQHAAEIASLQERLAKCTEDLKESNERCKHIEHEKTRELEAHKEITAKKMEEKLQEQISAIRKRSRQLHSEELAKTRREMLDQNLHGQLPQNARTDSLGQKGEDMLLSTNLKRKVDRRNLTGTANTGRGEPSSRLGPLRKADDNSSKEPFDKVPQGDAVDNSAEGVPSQQGFGQLLSGQPSSPNLFEVSGGRQSVRVQVPETQIIDQTPIRLSPPFDSSVDMVPETQRAELHSQGSDDLLFPCSRNTEQLYSNGEESVDLGRLCTPESRQSRRVANRSPLQERNQVRQKYMGSRPAAYSSEIESPSRPKSQANIASRMVPPLSSGTRDTPSPVSKPATMTSDDASAKATSQVKLPYPQDSSGQKRKVQEACSDASSGSSKRSKGAVKLRLNFTPSSHSSGNAQPHPAQSSQFSGPPVRRSSAQRGNSRRTKSSRYDLRFSQELE